MEEDLRSAIQEKQLLRDTERILLNTFDTLKQYYDTKESNLNGQKADEQRSKNSEQSKEEERTNKCHDCNYETKSKTSLRDHIIDLHHGKNTGHRHKESRNVDESQNHPQNGWRCYQREERKSNGFCVLWNRGYCKYKEFCRFSHEESPYCIFQENCRRKQTCRYFHEDMSFLDQRCNQWQSR